MQRVEWLREIRLIVGGAAERVRAHSEIWRRTQEAEDGCEQVPQTSRLDSLGRVADRLLFRLDGLLRAVNAK